LRPHGAGVAAPETVHAARPVPPHPRSARSADARLITPVNAELESTSLPGPRRHKNTRKRTKENFLFPYEIPYGFFFFVPASCLGDFVVAFVLVPRSGSMRVLRF